MGRECLACDEVVNVNARQEGFLCECPDLCAAVGVAQKGIVVGALDGSGTL